MRALVQDRRGSTIIEFALAGPVLMLMILGGFELGHTMYVKSVFEGQMQKAGRDQSLEDAQTPERRAAIEQDVREQVQRVAKSAVINFSRTAFRDYSKIENPGEDFIDANANGACDAGETYLDINNNSAWDANSAELDSAGGAKDVILYRAELTYERLPLGELLGLEPVELVAETILRNQPFDQQRAASERECA